MTAEGTRYVELAAELKKIAGNVPRYTEIAGEMDRIWGNLTDLEREEIDGLLISIDEVERTGKGYPPADFFTDE